MSNNLLKKERDPFFDSLKFILTAMVVMGHSLQGMLESSNQLLFTTYTFTQLFRIPLFIFVSGYFSKDLTWDKYKKGLFALLVTYFLFQTIYYFDVTDLKYFSITHFLLEPKGLMWYIMALILWRGFFSILPRFKYDFPIMLTLSVAASLIIGFKITTIVFEGLRVVTFFPYFVLGYYCKSETISKIRNWNKLVPFFILVFGFIAVYEYMPHFFRLSLYGTFSYKILFKEAPMWGMWLRLISFPIAVFFGIMVINIATSSFAKWGKKTVFIYLLHPIVMFTIYFGILEHLNIEQTFLGNMIAFPIIVAVCVYISRYQVFQFVVNPVDFIKKKKVSPTPKEANNN